MKEAAAAALLALLCLFVPPLFYTAREAPPPAETENAAPRPPAPEEPAARTDDAVTLRVKDGEQVRVMTLAEYLPGVVRGEMPAVFEPAALEAQAAAERTYACYHLAAGPKAAHPEADVCTDPACCSAWMSDEEARARWGENYEAYNARVCAAVAATDGQVILYGGEPILAAFHSSSPGSTASSADVWVADLPYLRSVASPENGDTVPNYYSVVSVPAADFRAAVLGAYPQAELSGDPSGWITGGEVTDGGRVKTLTVGGAAVPGSALRTMFGLRSASFTAAAEGEEIVFRVTGYGHGVGMSQYGANELARQGKTWQEIVSWYYTGVTVGPIPGA